MRASCRRRFQNVVDLMNKPDAVASAERQGRASIPDLRRDFLFLQELGCLPFTQIGRRPLNPPDPQDP